MSNSFYDLDGSPFTLHNPVDSEYASAVRCYIVPFKLSDGAYDLTNCRYFVREDWSSTVFREKPGCGFCGSNYVIDSTDKCRRCTYHPGLSSDYADWYASNKKN